MLQTAEIQSPQSRRIAQIISRWSQHRLTADGWESRPSGKDWESRGALSRWNEIAGRHDGPVGLGLGLPMWLSLVTIRRTVACHSIYTATHIMTKYTEHSIILLHCTSGICNNHSLRSRRDRLHEESFGRGAAKTCGELGLGEKLWNAKKLFGAHFSRQSCARVEESPPKLSHEQQ